MNIYDDVPIILDRKIENKDVLAYQKTQCPKLLDVIVKRRLPTIGCYTQLHHKEWMDISIEDFEQEMSTVLMKAINIFKPNYRDFNTLLYTCFLNHTRNMITARFCRKRKAEKGLVPLDAPVKQVNQQGETQDFKSILPSQIANEHQHSELQQLVEYIIDKCQIEKTDIARDWLIGVAYGDYGITHLKHHEHRKIYQRLFRYLKRNGITHKDLRKLITT